MNTHPPEAFRLVVVSAGTGEPSSTRMLADRVAERAAAVASRHGNTVTASVIELREISAEISAAMASQLTGPGLRQAIDALGQTDGIVAATPVYKAGPSGLFTSFFQVLDNDLLIAKPALGERIDRAALELVLLMESGFARSIREESWRSYRHDSSGGGAAADLVDLDSDLMRLAAGGSAG
jgi:FMN reductase